MYSREIEANVKDDLIIDVCNVFYVALGIETIVVIIYVNICIS